MGEIGATKLYRRGQYKEDLKITVGRVPMRVQKCMAVDKRADELLRVSPVSSLLSLYLWNMLRVRSLAREENFVEEIFSLATVSPPKIVRLQFLSVPGFDTYIRVQCIYHARPVSPICIPMSRIDVSDCRLTSSPPLVAIFSCLFFFSTISRHVDVDSIRIAQHFQSHYYRKRIISVSNKRFLDLYGYLISP